MATIEEMADQVRKQARKRKTNGANNTAGVQDTSAVKSVSAGTGSANTGSTAKKMQSIEEMANQVRKQARDYKAAHPVTNTVTTTTASTVKPYVSYADYGQGLLDRVNKTEERAKKLDELLKQAPAAISNQDQTLKRVEAEADSIYKSGAWATNPIVSDMIKKLYDEQSMTANKLETMRKAYISLTSDAQKATEEYLAAVDAYNGFYGFTGEDDTADTFRIGSGSAWDEWRRSIRSEAEIQEDLNNVDREIERINSTDDPELAAKLVENEGTLRRLIDYIQSSGNYSGDMGDVAKIEAAYGISPEKSGSLSQYLADIQRVYMARGSTEEMEKKKALLNEELKMSKYLKWEELRNNTDFTEKSSYTPKEGWKGEFNALAGRYTINDQSAFDYEYVNKNPEAQGAARVNDVQSGASFLGVDQSFLEKMEPEEISMYNYVYATQGADKAREYLKDLQTSLTARQRTDRTKEWRKYAAKDGWGASAFSVLASPMKALSYMGQVADYMQDGSIDQNAGYNKFSYINSTIRDEVGKKIESSGKWGKVGSFLYQTGMSMVDFIYTTAISGGSTAGGNEKARKAAESIALSIMGTSAAADSVIEAKDRGLSDDQAFALGTIAGLAEVVTEKVSLETLLNGTKWSKSAVGYFLANTIAEGSEEAASDLINWAADVLIAQDQSQWREDIRALMEAHPDWSENRAFGEALKSKAAEIGLDALGGALSGGVMAIPGSANMAVNSRRLGGDIQMGGMDAARALIEQGRSYGPKTPAAKLAMELQNKISAGGTPTKAELGYLEMANRNAAEEQRAKGEKEKSAPEGAETPQNTAAPQNEQVPTPRPETNTAPTEGAEAKPESATGGENKNPAVSMETADEELTLAERKVMLEKRKSALQERTRKYIEATNRGEDTGELGNELYQEAEDIEAERRSIEAEERARELRAENEELSERQRALTVAPTGKQIQERQERAGNLRELERSGRESGATEEQIETARRISNATGRKIVFVNESSVKRGYYQSGTIYVDAARGNEMEQIIAHELTHSIENSNLYGDFSRLVQQRIVETTGDLEERLEEITTRYAANGVKLENDVAAMKEVVAEYVEHELLTSEEAITSLVKENRSLGRRILDLLDKLLAKLRVKGAKERAFVQTARDLYARALVETRSEVDTQAALDEARVALGNGEISDEEFDRIYDALGVGIEEGTAQNSIAVSQRQEVAGRLRSMLNSGASIREIQRYVNSVAGTETRKNSADTKSDGARRIVEAAHRSNMSVDEYLRQNWDEYEVDGELTADARRAMDMEGARQYSIAEDFTSKFDTWLNDTDPNGKFKTGGYFRVGKTSEALKSIGVNENTIYWDKGKIADIMKKHPEMTPDVIKQVPQILENPILVMQSKTRANRITLFGELTDADGTPILAAMELRPQNKRGEILNYSKVTSAYAKQAAQNLIDSSDILYVEPNKNRTDSWLEALRLQLPAGLTKYGSIGRVTYSERDVNGNLTFGDNDGKTEMQRAFERAGEKMKEGPSTAASDINAISAIQESPSDGTVTQPGGKVKTQFSVADGTQTEAEGQEKQETDIRLTLPTKARGDMERVERRLKGSISLALNVPMYSQADFLNETVQNISREYLQNGKVSDETIKSSFESAYQKGNKVSQDFYREYKSLGEALQKRYLKPTDEEINNIGDYWSIVRSSHGTLHIVSKVDGTSIGELYKEFSGKYPEIFPANIAEPRDQLIRLFEASRSVQTAKKFVKDVEAGKYKEFKAWARNDFEVAVSDAVAELRITKRYSDDRAAQAKAPETILTLEEVKELYPKARDARKNYEKVSAKELLTAEDQRQVGRLMRGDIELSDLKPERDNVKGITAVYNAKQEYEKYARQIREWNEARHGQLRAEADEYLKTANGWKDKKKGIMYARETQERNIRDIVKDQKLADRIIKKYFTPVHEAAAKANKLKNRIRNRVRELNISRRIAEGNKVSEAHAVQLLGEALDNIDYLTHARTVKERDGKSLADWRGVVQELYETNPNMDWDRVKKAVEEFRKIYDELFELMNDSRVRNGYEPVAYRKGYFPHFQPGEGDSLISRFGKALGISTEVTALPTTINGLTHTFRPGIQWFGNALERTGFSTAYDAVEGIDKYIEGVADVIYQTENIQRLRALASQIRYRTGDEGLRRQVDEVRANTSLTEQDKENRIKEIYESGKYALSNYVVDLEEYTNILANKKSRADRNMEQALGRDMYNLVKSVEGRIAANMVAINPASWLTNLIPLTQGGAMLDRGMLIRGMWDTVKAIRTDDGFVGTSTFLTNRRGSDPLVRTW